MGCASLPVEEVTSENQNDRVQVLVLHFTSVPFEESMHLLTRRTERPVSAHYLVPEPGDVTYPHAELKIFRLVPESRRAWHAGRSEWRGRGSLNASSIGVEIVNRSRCKSLAPEAEVQTPEALSCVFLDFSEPQIELVIRLLRDILSRHPEIDPVDIVGHSDIAPTRRQDPGPTFPWKRLYDHGIGAWPDEDTVRAYRHRFQDDPPSLEIVQQALAAYGYSVPRGGENDPMTRFVVRAFQLHFRPSTIDGAVDVETASILFALLEKYRPRALRELLAEMESAFSSQP